MREKEHAGAAHEADDSFTRTPLDAPFSAPSIQPPAPHPRRRAATLAATALLIVSVAVGLFVHASTDPGEAIATLLRLATPTPTATMAPGSDTVYLSNDAPWGFLTLDGHQRLHGQLQGGWVLLPGRHHLDYQARYFPSVSCNFSVPQSHSDTCPLDTSPLAEQFLSGQGLARIIDLGSTGATLQPEQLDALKQIANGLLSQMAKTTVIATGDRYWDGAGHLVAATAPLRITLSDTLSDATAPGAEHACSQFCPEPSFVAGIGPGSPDVQDWPMRVTIAQRWTITDTTGRLITAPNYTAGQRYSSGSTENVTVSLTPFGWRLSGLADLTTQGVFMAAANALDQAAAGEGGGDYSTTFRLASNPLDGCVMGVQYHGSTISLLWRFGVLFTVDDAARRVFPQLPTVNAAEQARVDDIMAHGNQP